MRQVAIMRDRLPYLHGRSDANMLTGMVIIERMADCCAQSEFSDLGIDAATIHRELANLIKRWFGR